MTSHLTRGFPPIAGPDARILILGSLPGRRSIAAGEYYAHPRNAFWPILGDLCGADGDYPSRCKCLVESRIAVWDVLQASERPGSMDADIRRETAAPNDFGSFLRQHPGIQRIGFNGKAAGKLFMQLVAPALDLGDCTLTELPSTSPAHAQATYSDKLEAWRRFVCVRPA